MTIPVVALDGGAALSTDDTSPWIYGTSAEQAGTTVHVNVGGQSITASVVSGGTWGVSAQAMSIGSHPLVASVTDAAGNTGTATQTLTITSRDPVAPEPPKARYRPDAAISPPHGAFVGAGIYALSKQRVIERLNGKTRSAKFKIRVTNRGDASDRMAIRGTAKQGKFKVKYFAAGRNVTSSVKAGTYVTKTLLPGSSINLTMKVTRKKSASSGDKRTFKIRAMSAHSASATDTLAAVVRISR